MKQNQMNWPIINYKSCKLLIYLGEQLLVTLNGLYSFLFPRIVFLEERLIFELNTAVCATQFYFERTQMGRYIRCHGEIVLVYVDNYRYHISIYTFHTISYA